MPTNNSLTAEKVIALLIMAWGVGWLGRYSSTASDALVPVAVAGVLGITAIAVGLSVWKASPRALAGYVAWAVADVVGLVSIDALAGEGLWKSAQGGALAAAVLSVFGFALVAARRPRLLVS